MKIAIDQKVLISSLERGAMAALSDAAQGDTSSFSTLIKSVKITVDEDFVVESGTNLLSTKWSIKATKENGITVKEQGTVLVPAKELLGWASKQNKSKLVLNFVKLATPEIIKTGDGESDIDYSGGKSLLIKKIGSLKLASRDESKTGNKWNVDCYDHSQLSSVDFSKIPDKVIKLPTCQMECALRNVSFSSQPKDYQHVFDSVVIEKYKGNVYMAASDMHRCSIYKLDKATEVDEKFFTETNNESGSTVFGQKVLIPLVSLKSVSKSSESNDISISYDKDKSKVYIDAGNWKVRITTVSSSVSNAFPSVALLMSKKYKNLGKIPKDILVNRLACASLVNKSDVLFDFNKNDNGDSVIIHAISESGHSPNVSNAPVIDLVKELKAIWGVQHIIDVIKVIKDKDINFMVPEDLKSVKIVSEEDKNLEYFSMVIDNPKYSNLLKG